MHSSSFDTLLYAKKLREAGVPEAQAEAHAEALRAVVDANLATKHDIELVRHDMELIRGDIEALRSETKRDVEAMRSETKRDIELMRRDILIRLGGIFVAGSTVACGLIGVVIALLTVS